MNREIILKCTQTNADYMRLPAGMVDGYRDLVALYKRIAQQSLDCAKAWVANRPCPDHEPAVDAFWWGIVSWAEAIGTAIGTDPSEWATTFVAPHEEFAESLRPGSRAERLAVVTGNPGEVVMHLDAAWMMLVVKLTAQWGLFRHLKDRGAMMQARSLDQELRRPGSPAYKAYLQSDLAFFRQLFKNFSFRQETVVRLSEWLNDLEGYTASI